MYVSNDGKIIANYNMAHFSYQETQGYYYLPGFDELMCSFKGFPHTEELFECDDLMAPILSELNKKGYKTKYSCNGHFSKLDKTAFFDEIYGVFVVNDNEYIHFSVPYIMFDENVVSISDIIGENETFPVDGWNIEFDKDLNHLALRANRNMLEKCVESEKTSRLSYYKFYGKLLELHSNLFEWAYSLPIKNSLINSYWKSISKKPKSTV